jgi:hypothetical protein
MESLRSSADFKELLSLFNEESVRYLIVGGFALAAYGRPRYTKDLDVWIDPAGDNPARVYRALARFGAPLGDITAADLGDSDAVVQLGVEPIRIDILSDISGVRFDEAWPRRQASNYGDVPVHLIAQQDYVNNKRASGRPQDIRDVESLLDDTRD